MARTKTPTGNETTTKIRCKRCHFWCDTERDKTGSGSGVSLVSTTDAGRTFYDPQVVAGCPNCGTKNYMNWQK